MFKSMTVEEMTNEVKEALRVVSHCPPHAPLEDRVSLDQLGISPDRLPLLMSELNKRFGVVESELMNLRQRYTLRHNPELGEWITVGMIIMRIKDLLKSNNLLKMF